MLRFSIAFIGLLLPSTAFAQYRITNTGWACNGFLYCSVTPPDVVVAIGLNIINGVLAFIGALGVVACFYGAILMITSRGEEGKEAGKKAVMYAALGIVAAMLVSSIIQYVTGYIYYLGT